MKLSIIDDFLHENDFNDISNIIMENIDFTWRYHRDIELNDNSKFFYMVHSFYRVNDISVEEHVPVIDHYYEVLEPLTSMFSEMGLKWWRIKCNLYPATESLKQHAFHIDNKIPHIAGLFSLNTCDGYTEFEDGTKIESIANRFFLFDGAIKHASTTTTNALARFNINFNFYPK